jgi:hypothetical protein
MFRLMRAFGLRAAQLFAAPPARHAVVTESVSGFALAQSRERRRGELACSGRKPRIVPLVATPVEDL